MSDCRDFTRRHFQHDQAHRSDTDDLRRGDRFVIHQHYRRHASGLYQQLIPAVNWAFAFEDKRRYFLVGSDYVLPRAAHEIMRDEIAELGAQVVGEKYLPLGSSDVEAAAEDIVAAKPDVILNTINGDGNVAFFRALRGREFRAPQGKIVVNPVTQHTLKTPRIGRVRADGQFDIVWEAAPAEPIPFPSGRSQDEWDEFLVGLYQSWGGQWSASAR